MIYLKTHSTENGAILAMCDSDLIGRIIEEGDVVIDLKNYSDFYIGNLINSATAKSSVQKEVVHTANIIGEESVAVALEVGIVEKSHIKRVMNVPYANSFRIK